MLKRLQECGFHISSWFPLVNLITEFWDGGTAVSRVMIIHKCMIAAGIKSELNYCCQSQRVCCSATVFMHTVC